MSTAIELPQSTTEIRRFFTRGIEGAVLDSVVWNTRDATISGPDGPVFHQSDVEAPVSWSDTAVNIVASKYFRGALGSPWRECSVKQLLHRVADTIRVWGLNQGYFGETDGEVLYDELLYLLVHQKFSFNSPVWFNLGVHGADAAQCSACFINSVEDTMDSILDLAKTEARLFKGGSGSGVNLSKLRGSMEPLQGGGLASGPLSFMRGHDAFAGAIKSGGKTRRAAKMVLLDADHPDILEFVRSKSKEEKKAHALIEEGYDGAIDGEAYGSVFFQNANHSVRFTDDFMRAADSNETWKLTRRVDGETSGEMPARQLLREVAKATHECGDPGVHYSSTINAWHTVPNHGPISASNPCSEYLFVDDSACNLASLKLTTFDTPAGFDALAFEAAIDVIILAMDILVDGSSYPTDAIARNSHRYRPLGLGYTDLGALLMKRGLAYDSQPGRQLAGALTSLMASRAYLRSTHIADSMGACEGYEPNRSAFMKVLDRHRDAAARDAARATGEARELVARSLVLWTDISHRVPLSGCRNSQTTVLAPTGTISFMMDCDTTGIEPAIALRSYKSLVGGGSIQILNGSVLEALRALGYAEAEADEVENSGSISGIVKKEHLPVFACALGDNAISPLGHVRMMGAVQPFLSGAISKTVNLPHDSTIEDIEDIYFEGWRQGLKAIAVYRDGCKRTQPLSLEKETQQPPQKRHSAPPPPVREKLPRDRNALTHKFSVAGHEGYLTIGLYENGAPGEIFIRMSKEGSTISGLVDSLATSVSLALQYGVPLEVLADKLKYMRFEPSGFTGNPEIPSASSVVDYIFRYLEARFQTQQELEFTGAEELDTPMCPSCGSLTVRAGSCHSCPQCGATTGCG